MTHAGWLAIPGLQDPYVEALSIVPSDSEDLPHITRAIYVGKGGDMRVQMLDGMVITFANTKDGTVYPIRVRRVYATGTKASNIMGLL